jgi:hypothetical protein
VPLDPKPENRRSASGLAVSLFYSRWRLSNQKNTRCRTRRRVLRIISYKEFQARIIPLLSVVRYCHIRAFEQTQGCSWSIGCVVAAEGNRRVDYRSWRAPRGAYDISHPPHGRGCDRVCNRSDRRRRNDVGRRTLSPPTVLDTVTSWDRTAERRNARGSAIGYERLARNAAQVSKEVRPRAA